MKECIVGTDMCGTSMKVGAFTKDGERLYLAQRKQIPIITKEGHFYFDKQYQENMLFEMLKEIIQKKFKILSIGIGSCGESVYPIDKEGEIIDNAIAWYCTRTNEQEKEFREKTNEKDIFRICYLKPFYNYSAHKINWFKKHKPNVFNNAVSWVSVDGFINYILTGTKYMSYNQAGTTLLFDTKKRCWSDELLEINELKKETLPELIESGELTGFINEKSKDRLGIKYDIPVSLAGHDTWCGFFALGLGTSKQFEYVPNFTGTAGLTNIGKFIGIKDLVDNDIDYFYSNFSWVIPHVYPDKYHCRGTNTSNYGALLEFTRKLLFNKDKNESWDIYYNRIEKEVEFSSPGANGVRIYASENELDGKRILEGINFLNLRLSSSKADIYRAVIEYLCLLDKKNLNKFEKLNNERKKILVFGGLSKDKSFMKIRASILNRELFIPTEEEVNVLGAAFLGGVGAKLFKDYDKAIESINITCKDVIKPDNNLVDIYHNIYQNGWELD